MALPTFTMRQLLEAGVHFGHQTRRWNPKMAPYLFGVRNDAHIVDLQQTVPLLHRALQVVRDTVAGGGRVLFVGTKRQAGDIIAAAAKRCGQFYVNHRWLGGMLTNWKTISVSIRRLRALEEQLEAEDSGLTKKELLRLTRERDKLERALGGIKEMGGLPDILFIIDTNKEDIAIAESSKLGIPVVAVIDSNSNPDPITYAIPGNDDAIRAITLYCQLMSDAVLDGIQEEMQASGVDLGAAETTAPAETLAAPGEAPGDAKVDKPKEPATSESGGAPEETPATVETDAAADPATVAATSDGTGEATAAASDAAAAPISEDSPVPTAIKEGGDSAAEAPDKANTDDTQVAKDTGTDG